jgi:hypothetical protein
MDEQFFDGVQIVEILCLNIRFEILSGQKQIPHFMQLPKRPIQLPLSRMVQIASAHLQLHVMCTIQRLHVMEVGISLYVMEAV